MKSRIQSCLLALTGIVAWALIFAGPGFALSTKECSAKYKAAKTAGTLNGESWNDFRKKQCAAAEPASASDAKATAKAAAPTATAAVLPKSIDPKYAKKSAGKARFYTCLDQYRANKAANGNGGLRWIQRGGGYYSKCNAALKS